MTHAAEAERVPGATLSTDAAAGASLRGWLLPASLAALVVAAISFALVVATPSAWRLLGAGRGLVPEWAYPYSGFVIVLATTLGHFLGWVAGSAFLVHLWAMFSPGPASSRAVRGAMLIVYLALGALPLLAFHILFGGPLLGLAREGLPDWLRANHPDAHALLYPAHPVIDWAPLPLGIAVAWILWRVSDERLAGTGPRFVLALLVLGTSLAVTLSLAVHSILVHIRL